MDFDHASIRIRKMQPDDIQSILQVQEQVYPSCLLEGADFYLNKIMLTESICFVAEKEGKVVGYFVSYPWQGNDFPELGQITEQLPSPCENWFVHDCAVLPEVQGEGVARCLYKQCEQMAITEGCCNSSLVALENAISYWTQKGYVKTEDNSQKFRQKLSKYGEGAYFMKKVLKI